MMRVIATGEIEATRYRETSTVDPLTGSTVMRRVAEGVDTLTWEAVVDEQGLRRLAMRAAANKNQKAGNGPLMVKIKDRQPKPPAGGGKL